MFNLLRQLAVRPYVPLPPLSQFWFVRNFYRPIRRAPSAAWCGCSSRLFVNILIYSVVFSVGVSCTDACASTAILPLSCLWMMRLFSLGLRFWRDAMRAVPVGG